MEKTIKRGCGFIIEKDNKILLLKRSPNKKFEPNKWNLPGGHVELEETPLDGAKRELFEEAGIKLNPELNPALIGTKILESGTEFEINYFVFYYKLPNTDIQIKINNESTDYGWFTLEQIKKLDLCRGEDESFKFLTLWESKTDPSHI